MNHVRKLAAIVALAPAALTPAALHAGGLSEPVMEQAVVVEESSASSSDGLVVPMMLMLMLVAVASANGSGVSPASDMRLKTDIRATGRTAAGLPLYQFRYRGTPILFEGVMAQDVLSVRPDAVIMDPSGYMRVDYPKLGLRMRIVE